MANLYSRIQLGALTKAERVIKSVGCKVAQIERERETKKEKE